MTSTLLSRRNLLRAGGLSLVAAFVASCATKPPPATPGVGEDQSAAFVPMINALRAKNGLPPVSVDPAATKAALYQANRMADAGKMAHLMGFGDNFGTRVKASGVRLPAAENIAVGQQTNDAAMTAWINSPHHLENMLGRYSGIGVAVARNPASNNHPYWAMVLSN